MANVAHSALTGSNLHEPKGIATAAAGTVYIADGAASGAWSSSTSIATGMIADFVTPIAPSGWLELDGSAISTTTFSTLYTAMTIQQSGARGSGSAIVTGLSSTTNMKAGYYVFGTGITSGTQILTVDSSTQITMTANASSSGTATVIVSPWLVAATTITLPDTKTLGRFRRSRTTTTHMGVSQADQNSAHTHSVSGTTGAGSAHNHTVSISDPGHQHTILTLDSTTNNPGGNIVGGINGGANAHTSASATTGITATSGNESAHTHSFSATSGSSGSAEARPLTLVVMTCVKT